MAHRRGSRKRLIAPLMLVLMFIASHHSAAPAAKESAHRAARAALDRGETARAVQMTDAALAAAGTRRDAEYHALRILRAELHHRQGETALCDAILNEKLPPQLATREAAVYRQILLARSKRDPAFVVPAREIATKHQPRLLPLVTMTEIGFGLVEADLDAVTRKAVAQARSYGDGSIEARLKGTRGYRLVKQRRFAEAIRALEEAATIAEKLRLAPTLANAQGNMGWAYWALGDLENAAEIFARAEATTRERGLFEEQVPWLLQLGNVAYERREYALAAKHYAGVLTLARRFPSRTPEAGFAAENLAVIALHQGRLGEARRFHDEAWLLKKSVKDSDALARSEIVGARLDMHDQRFDNAKQVLERIAKESKKKAIQWEARGNLAQLYLKMKREDLAEPQFRQAIETMRDARDDIKEQELRLSFFSRATEILDPYLDFLISQGRNQDALAAVDAYRAQTLEEELGVTRPRTFNAQAIARAANATILSYWLGEQRSYLWVITPDRVTLRTLPLSGTAINAAADAYQRELLGRRGTLAQSAARGIALYQMLIEPAGTIARDARVVVIPDGRLHNINFETLVVPSPKPHYWIEDAIVTTARSLQLLSEAPKTALPSPKMLLVGDPPQADPAFPKLAHAAREINAIALQFAKPTVLRGDAATPSAYAAAKPETFDYLHFVAHGVATRQKPLDSAVILGRDKNSKYRLSAREIVETPLRAKLVTISSCTGAGSRTYGGEGLVGLAWAFLSAGADQVIAALWEVNDAATADLMKQMYGEIRKGRDPATALRAAKLSLVRSGTIHAKPSYWAPFVLYAGR